MGIKNYVTPRCTFYAPKNAEKYIGKDKRIICRSSWEGKVCQWLDGNPNILQWCSECVVIKYIDPIEPIKNGRPYVRNYYPDFYAVIKTNSGNIERHVIEIKPKNQTKAPRRNNNPKTALLEAKTWKVNQAKWAAAQKFCTANGLRFTILTEDNIFGRK